MTRYFPIIGSSLFSFSTRRFWIALACAALVACGGSGGGSDATSPPVTPPADGNNEVPPAPPPTLETRHYEASVVRTQYGVPHITANDWGSLGFGYGHAFAQDNLCTLLTEIIYARGESMRWFGAAGNADSDFIYTLLNGDSDKMRREWIDVQPDYVQQLVRGYVDGFNHYLAEAGPTGIAPACRGAAWLAPITDVDMVKFLRKLAQQGSVDNGNIRDMVMGVSGPTLPVPVAAPLTDDEAETVRSSLKRLAKPIMDISTHGSNAYALGREATQNGRGMLLGNPHQPWHDTGRFYQVHMTYPGVYDAMGASLFGLPMVNLGFNENLAWSHTVSGAARFSFYELKINPQNSLQYQYGTDDTGAPVWRDITVEPVTIQVQQPDGSLKSQTHNFYRSHYGFITNLAPIIDNPIATALIGTWPMRTGTLLTMRDANQENNRGLVQWLEMGKAKNLEEFTQALAMIGIPWVNTIAVDRAGKAYYGDISTVPHIDNAKFSRCTRSLVSKIILGVSHNQIITLNGADPACEWGRDADSPAGADVFGYSSLPKLYRDDYVANSNDSYWLSNPHQLLTGFPVVMGTFSHEGMQQFLRTQLAHDQVAKRLDGSDGYGAPKFSLESLQKVMYSSRVLGAERYLDDMLEICNDSQKKMYIDGEWINFAYACDVLAAWDRTTTLDSIGAQIFTEMWMFYLEHFEEDYVIHEDTFWETPFDPSQPLTTPIGINKDYPITRNLILESIARAVKNLQDAGVALDAPWRDVQYVTRNGEDIPIHGGYDWMGTFSVTKVELSAGGYREIHGGNTYIQTVTWDDTRCPVAQGVLTHSQSTNPDNPHYADQTVLYSQQVWPALPFCAGQISATQIGEPRNFAVDVVVQ